MINIDVVDNNGIIKVLGTLYEDYPERETDLKEFTYDNTVSINLIYDSDGKLIGDAPYNTNIHFYRGLRYMDDYVVDNLKDGLYTFKQIVLPTKEHLTDDLGIVDGATFAQLKDQLNEAGYYLEWEDSPNFIMVAFNTDTNQIEQATFCHSGDITDHTFWIEWKQADFQDVIDALPYIENTTMLLAEAKFFKYSDLYKCFINQAQNLLSLYTGDKNFCTGSKLCFDQVTKKYSQEIQIRDYLWAAINVLKYCIEMGNYEQAQKILNCVSSCSGICSGNGDNNSSSNGCGCNN